MGEEGLGADPATDVEGLSGLDSREDPELRKVLDCEETLCATSIGTGGMDLGEGGGGTEGGGVRGGSLDPLVLENEELRSEGRVGIASERLIARESWT